MDNPKHSIVLEFGAVCALYDIANQLGVVNIVDKYAPKRDHGLSVGEYRKKASNGHTGLETCADENPVQLITDYTVEKNTVSDTEMMKERLPEIQNRTDLTDLYVDGGYFSGEIEEQVQDMEVTVH